MQLSARKQAILTSVVEIYIETGRPVSSAAVARHSTLKVSTATIRAAMADMARDGLLRQRYASAGRIPTELGFRVYLDTAINARLRPWDRTHLNAATQQSPPDRFVESLGRRLAGMSGHMAVVAVPRLLGNRFVEVGLARCSAGKFVAYLVSPSGLVQQKLVKVDFDLDTAELQRLENYLNDIIADRTIDEVRALIPQELMRAEAMADHQRKSALELGQQALPDRDLELVVEGSSHLAAQPDFDDESLQRLLQAIEERSALLRIMDRIFDGQGVQVVLGSEHPVAEMDSVACVGGLVSPAGRGTAAIGLMGPARMDYERLIPLVRYATELFGEFWRRL